MFPIRDGLRSRALGPWCLALCALILTMLMAPEAFARRTPELLFEAPSTLERVVTRLEDADTTPYHRILRLVGLDDPGPPITVRVVKEGSSEAELLPGWGVAYALSEAGQIVLIPSRIPSYPDSSLETVLHHEVAHVLIARAAGRRRVPRWFHEGVAIAAAREIGWNDRARLFQAAWRRDGSNLRRLDASFHAGAQSSTRAYALSAAFVRFLLEEHGRDAVARILARVAEGKPFDDAFEAALGRSVMDVEQAYWKRLDWGQRWLPLLTSSTTLWIGISLLAVVAYKRRRERDAELREVWAEEEAVREEAWRLEEERRAEVRARLEELRPVDALRQTPSGEWVN